MLNKTLLGSAAVLVTMVGAQAADLPSKKAAPATYVKICDAYGAGFYTIPGTDTCVKVGGYLRAEYAYAPAGNAVVPGAAPTAVQRIDAVTNKAAGNYAYAVAPLQVHANGQDTSGFLSRGVVQLDARTPTGFGTARTYMAIRGENKSGLYGNTALTGAFGASPQAASISVDRAFVQFAGFTFGRGDDQFSFMPAPNFISYAWSGYPSGINQLSYTAVIGGGVSATVSLKDRGQQSQSAAVGSLFTSPTSNMNDTSVITAVGLASSGVAATSANSGVLATVVNGPMRLPELAGNIRLDQGWGSAQVMGSVLQNAAVVSGASIYTLSGTAYNPVVAVQSYNNQFLVTGGNSGNQVSKTGWAVGAGVKINLPMIAAGDTLWLTAAYADGNLDRLQSSSTSDRSANIGREFTGLIRQDRNLYVVPTAWSMAATGITAKLDSVKVVSPTGWSAGAIYTHYWTPTFRSNFIGSYLSIKMPAEVKAVDSAFGGLSDVTVTQIGHSFVWSPVKDLNLGLETAYARLNQSQTGTAGAAPIAAYTAANQAASGNATTAVTKLDAKTSPSLFAVRLRVDRQF